MREARIVFPWGNRAQALAYNIARDRLIHAFGGATVLFGDGHWVKPDGALVTEPVAIVDVAVPWETPPGCLHSNNDRNTCLILGSIAQEFRVAAGETAVYLRYPDGEVDILTSEEGNGHAQD